MALHNIEPLSDTQEPILLLIDTSTTACSSAIVCGEHIITSKVLSPEHGAQASTALAPMVNEQLEILATQSLGLSAIAVSAGPGSYTGLRVGSSFAKGLCFGLSIPLIEVSTLELLATQARLIKGISGADKRLYPMIDARRMEVYTACFDGDGKRLSADSPLILSSEEDLTNQTPDSYCYFVGDGAGKVRGLWEAGSYEILDDIYPEASYMASLALGAYRDKRFVDLAYWTPNYLKEYIATIAKNKVIN